MTGISEVTGSFPATVSGASRKILTRKVLTRIALNLKIGLRVVLTDDRIGHRERSSEKCG